MTANQPQIVLCELGKTTIEGLESYSPLCLKVHRALGIAGLAYVSRHGAPTSFRELNPARQVPVLLVDGRRRAVDRAEGPARGLRPALTDWLDRVDTLNVSRPEAVAARGELTAPRGHDMTRACPSPIPIHVQA